MSCECRQFSFFVVVGSLGQKCGVSSGCGDECVVCVERDVVGEERVENLPREHTAGSCTRGWQWRGARALALATCSAVRRGDSAPPIRTTTLAVGTDAATSLIPTVLTNHPNRHMLQCAGEHHHVQN